MPRSKPLRSLCAALLLAASVVACTQPSPPAPTPTPSPAAPGWTRLPAPADLPVDRPLQVGFLIVDGVYGSELMAPFDVFQHTIFHTDPRPGMEVFTVSPDGAVITTFEGLKITPTYSFTDAPAIDVLVVPSAEHSMDSDLENAALIGWVHEVGSEARIVVSLCDGAFVLAKAGLLEDRAVTTFPGDQDRFAEMFPQLDLRREVSFVHDGRALTGAGGAKSYDPAMYLVDHFYGEAAAQGIGRGLLIPWPPAAGAMPAVVVPAKVVPQTATAAPLAGPVAAAVLLPGGTTAEFCMVF